MDWVLPKLFTFHKCKTVGKCYILSLSFCWKIQNVWHWRISPPVQKFYLSDWVSFQTTARTYILYFTFFQKSGKNKKRRLWHLFPEICLVSPKVELPDSHFGISIGFYSTVRLHFSNKKFQTVFSKCGVCCLALLVRKKDLLKASR